MPRSTKKKTRRRSRDTIPKKKFSKSHSVSKLDVNEATPRSDAPVVASLIEHSPLPIGQSEDATNTGPNTRLRPDIKPRVLINRLTYNMFRSTTSVYAQNGQIGVEEYENASGRGYDNNPGKSYINMIGEQLQEDVFPHGVGPWDGFQLSLGMRLSYLDGEVRKYELRYEERTIDYIGSEHGVEPPTFSSPWRELEIPTIAIPYLIDFFEAPGVPGRNYLLRANKEYLLTVIDLCEIRLRSLQCKAQYFETSWMQHTCYNIPPIQDHSSKELWATVVEYYNQHVEPDILTEVAQVRFFMDWRIIPTDIPNIGLCEHATSVLAASSCLCNNKYTITIAKRLEREEYLMKWHIMCWNSSYANY